MKPYLRNPFLSLIVLTGTLVAEDAAPTTQAVPQPAPTQGQTLSVTDMTKETWGDFWDDKLEGVVIECHENALLPLDSLLRDKLSAMCPDKMPAYYARILKTFYIKSEGNRLLFSMDREQWRDLLPFLKETLSVVLEVDHHQPLIRLGTE